VAAHRNWKSEIAAAAHKKKVSLANCLTKVQLIANYLDNQLPMHRYVAMWPCAYVGIWLHHRMTSIWRRLNSENRICARAICPNWSLALVTQIGNVLARPEL